MVLSNSNCFMSGSGNHAELPETNWRGPGANQTKSGEFNQSGLYQLIIFICYFRFIKFIFMHIYLNLLISGV